MKTIAQRARSVHTVLGWLSHRQHQAGTVSMGASGIEAGRCTPPVRSGREQRERQESDVVARGVIRREEIPLLTRYGTSYGLFDEDIVDYECVLKSGAYRLGAYVGDRVRVSGPLSAVIEEMPVVEVAHLELLKMKWMRQ